MNIKKFIEGSKKLCHERFKEENACSGCPLVNTICVSTNGDVIAHITKDEDLKKLTKAYKILKKAGYIEKDKKDNPNLPHWPNGVR